MLTVNVITQDNKSRIVGTLNGNPYNVLHDEKVLETLNTLVEAYEDITEVAKLDEWTELVNDALKSTEDLNKDVIVEACPELLVRNGHYYIKGDNDKVLPLHIPEFLVDLILESIEKGISAQPIIKALLRWFDRDPVRMTQKKLDKFAAYITNTIVDDELVAKLMDEDGYSYDAAVSAATYPDVQITKSGIITCYKYADLVTEGYVAKKLEDGTTKIVKGPKFKKADDTVDFVTGKVTKGKTTIPEFVDEPEMSFLPPMMGTGGDAFFSRGDEGHEIHVGTTVELLGGSEEDTRAERIEKGWKMVNENDDISCVKGLHVGGRNYVKSYGGSDISHLLMCFVNPGDIGAIVDLNYGDGDGAIRTRAYYTYGAVEGRTKSIYHASTFSDKSEQDWKEYRKMLIERAGKKVEEAEKAAEKLN